MCKRRPSKKRSLDIRHRIVAEIPIQVNPRLRDDVGRENSYFVQWNNAVALVAKACRPGGMPLHLFHHPLDKAFNVSCNAIPLLCSRMLSPREWPISKIVIMPPPPPCNSYALFQATASVGAVLFWYLI